MKEQPEALRLADALDYGVYDAQMARVMDKAASQLRRLHAEVERLSLDGIHSCHAECQRPVCRLTRERDALLERADTLQRWYDQQLDRLAAVEAQRDALLEALKGMLLHMGMDEDEWNRPTFDFARAAIKAAEGENT